jgi:hypothetical protein
MVLEVILIVVALVLALGEWFVWDKAIFWHGEEKRDPRNFPPPR